MTVQSNHKRKRRDSHMKFKALGNHEEFLERIAKTLYYTDLPTTERFSLPLSELAVELYSEVKCGKSLERLTLEEASEISRSACISPCSLVLALIYLEQLKTSNPNYVDRVTPTDLFVISLMVASKFLNDSGEEDDFLNSEWAVSAGLSTSDINKLEMDFLNAIDWKVFVKDSSFWEKLRFMEARLALSEGKRRGWFSYMELEALLDQVNAFLLAQAVFTVSAVCLASYAAGMLTVIGSTMVATQLIYTPPAQERLHTDLHVPPVVHDIPGDPSVDFSSGGLDIYNLPLLNELFLGNMFNRSCYDCLEDTLLDDFIKQNNKGLADSVSNDNSSFFYNNFLVPISFKFIGFPSWNRPPLQIFSE